MNSKVLAEYLNINVNYIDNIEWQSFAVEKLLEYFATDEVGFFFDGETDPFADLQDALFPVQRDHFEAWLEAQDWPTLLSEAMTEAATATAAM